MKISTFRKGVAFALACLSLPALGSSLISNGSFEGGFAGWTTSGDISLGTFGAAPPTDGIYSASLNAFNLAPNALLSQGFGTVAGQTYDLSFDFGNWGNLGTTVTQGIRVSLIDSASALTLDTRDIFDATPNDTEVPSQVYTHYGYSFLATGANTILRFQDIADGTVNSDGLIDRVSVDNFGTGPGPGPAGGTGSDAGATAPLPSTFWVGLLLTGSFAAYKRLGRQYTGRPAVTA